MAENNGTHCHDVPQPTVGSAFGFWTVIDGNAIERRVLCRCQCGVEKLVYKLNLTRGLSRGCTACRGLTLLQKFEEKCVKSNGCWEWHGTKTKAGYGQMQIDKQRVYAHRVSYRLFHGVEPGDFRVCHHCDNPSCVNPGHLFLGTDADNVHDMDKKGRRVRIGQPGQAHPNAKLTDQQVALMRRKFKDGSTREELAAEFGVTAGNVWRIVTNRVWRHIA